MTKYCQHCGATNVPMGIQSRKGEKIYFLCRGCNNERCRKYYKDTNGEKIKKAVKKYEKENPEKRKAWSIAGHRITLQPCCVCGSKKSQRHHPDYSKPLVVVFLCAAHHKELHRKYDHSK